MTQIRLGTPGDAARERELWQLAFGDDGAYVDNFYQTYYKPERMLLLEEDGVVQSMTAWFDTQLVLPGEGRFRAAYLYAVATDPAARGRGLAGRLLAGADEYFRGLAIPAVTTVPAEPSLHNFFGANGFRECFTLFQEALDPGELPAPAWDNPLRPVSPAEYGAVREKILADCPHIAYPEEALAYQAGCCALSGGGLFAGETEDGPVCACAEGDGAGGHEAADRSAPSAPDGPGGALSGAGPFGPASGSVRRLAVWDAQVALTGSGGGLGLVPHRLSWTGI